MLKIPIGRMPRALALLIVVAGSVALVWGGATLQGIFVEERDAAQAAIRARRRALEQYAHVALDRKLRAALERARPRIDAALADPLLEEPGLLMVDDGRQMLPRVARYRQGTDTPASRLYHDLEEGRASGAGPWGERLALLAELQKAIERYDTDAIAQSVRGFLNHQSRYVIPVAKDLPYRIYFLETFVDGATPDRRLLDALLRDGLRGTRGRRLVGLQPSLLANRDRFTRADFAFLAERLLGICRKARVVHDDFAARVEALAEEPVAALPSHLPGPALIARGAWFATPVEATALQGVAVELDRLLNEITLEMHIGGLLFGEDGVVVQGALGDVVAVPDVPLAVRSEALAAEAAEIDRRHALKTATAITLAALVVGVALLVSLIYRRERKFLEAQAGFLATVSHELRTPIASLRLMGETLERRLEGVEVARDFPSRIVGETDRLSFLIENVLSFNRLEKASVRTHLQDVTVAELMDSGRSDAAAFTKKPVSIRVETGSELSLRVDADLMKLLVSNLVNNACKYHRRDSVEIVVDAKEERDRTVLRITDNGIGIPKDEWEAIFTDFTRARNRGTSRGFGLGLALCRRIMSLHDGTICVIDSSDAGTTFEMVLPAQSEERQKQ